MNCREFEHYLDSYLDGDLQGTLKLEFEAHLVNCESCGHEYAMMEAVGQIIAAPTPAEPRLSEDFSDRVMAGLSAQRKKDLRFRWVMTRLSRAAAIVLLATGTLTYWAGHRNGAVPSPGSPSVATMAMVSDPTELLARTCEQAGSSVLGLKDLRSSAIDFVREGVFQFARPTPADMERPLPAKTTLSKTNPHTPSPAAGSSEPELEWR